MTTTVVKAGRQEWVGLIVLVLPALLVSMDISVFFFAMPRLAEDLTPSSVQMLWIMDIYGFLLAGLLVPMGSLGDRIGRRKTLLIGAVLFAAASVLAACAISPVTLIVARGLMGVGGATLAPSTLALIRNMFHDDTERTTAIGVWTAGFAGGSVLGPIIGGLLLESFWWGSVFLINVPVMLILIMLGPILLPEHRDPAPGRFDLLGALFALASVLPVIYGIKDLAETGFGPRPVVAVIVGVFVGVLFVRRQSHEGAMLDVTLFRTPAFSAPLAANTLVMFVMVGTALFMSQYLQVVHGLSPFTAALWLLPGVAGTMIGVGIAATLVAIVPPGRILSAGLLLGAVGFIVITQVEVHTSLVLIVAGSAVMSVGVGMVSTLATDLVISAAPPARAGGASALSETCNELGGALGIAILGSLGTAMYRSRFADTVAIDGPNGVSQPVADAARETLPGAVAAAETVSGEAARLLLDTAYQAFTQGLRSVAIFGAVTLIVAAAVVGFLLRDIPSKVSSR